MSRSWRPVPRSIPPPVPVVVVLLLLLVVLSACSLSSAPTPTATPVPKPATTATSVAPAAPTAKVVSAERVAAIRTAWESGRHNNKYDLYKGPNTYCAVCHSPLNWDPKATVNVPPNCFSCKFPTDKEVRISPKAPLIAEGDWKKLDCAVCHRVSASNVVDPAIAIWNNGTKAYEAVKTPSELCGKCHVDSIGGSRHMIRLGGGAHSNQIGSAKKRPAECTDCHDPHSMKADCKACHAASFAADTKTQGHDAAHAKVTCTACHDASGMKAAPVEAQGGRWLSVGISVTAGRESATPAYSHYFARAVDCTRCHYNDNPWKLRSLVPTPTPKPAASPVPSPTK
jgi:hypothetical protein